MKQAYFIFYSFLNFWPEEKIRCWPGISFSAPQDALFKAMYIMHDRQAHLQFLIKTSQGNVNL